ncbi:MAG: homoserine O-succinyltransferase [Christensenellales bacterium]
MPIIIPKDIPAFDALTNEHIFVMNTARAVAQDIRPIEIGIVNLMPTKIETEIQLMRLLSNTPLQVNVTLINTKSYKSKNISQSHLNKFYKTFDEVSEKHFDGLIITGAPVETLPFEEVKYWTELTEIMDWADKYVTNTIYICWGAQAALYHHYGIRKHPLPKKMFGIFPNYALAPYEPLLKGMNDVFYIPNSRHTAIDEAAVYANPELQVVARSDISGISIIKSSDNKRIYLTGHSEYDTLTLKTEYERDLAKGLDIEKPYNYFKDSECRIVENTWKNTANLLFYNWLNYYVYQITPYCFD